MRGNLTGGEIERLISLVTNPINAYLGFPGYVSDYHRDPCGTYITKEEPYALIVEWTMANIRRKLGME